MINLLQPACSGVRTGLILEAFGGFVDRELLLDERGQPARLSEFVELVVSSR